MAITSSRIVPCLWFDDQGEAAAEFYVGIFKNSKINSISRYGEAGRELHGKEPGATMTVSFELEGQPFTALNGGPLFKLSEAISLQVMCDTQDEIDYYWDKLTEGGDPAAQQCGWLKDKFGLSWQVAPNCIGRLMSDPATSDHVMNALLSMSKLDIAALEQAAAG